MDGVDWTAPGGMLFIAPVKGKKRAAEKVEQDYGGDWSQLLDPVRCSIAVDSYDDLKAALGALQKGGLKLARQPKDRFAKPLDCGYRDLMLNVTLPNGLIGEVQLHVKPMLAAKEAGHAHYEVERSLVGKGVENWTDEDKAKVEQAHAAQVKIYGDAWTQAMGGGQADDGRPAHDGWATHDRRPTDDGRQADDQGDEDGRGAAGRGEAGRGE